MQKNAQRTELSDWIRFATRIFRCWERRCNSLSKSHGTRDQLKKLNPRGSKISIFFSKIPNTSQCDPGRWDESILTIRKHGNEVKVILDTSFSAKHPMKFGTHRSNDVIVELDVLFFVLIFLVIFAWIDCKLQLFFRIRFVFSSIIFCSEIVLILKILSFNL